MDNAEKERDKKVIIWSTEIMNLLQGLPVGGIAVQMHFWAQAFVENGWKVYSFSTINKQCVLSGIVFNYVRRIRFINFLFEWWRAYKYISMIRPDIVIYRGANRALLPLALFSKLFRVRLVFFSASDVNFEPGKELVGNELNRKSYQHSIRLISYFVTQNKYQHDTLLKNYSKKSLILYNIWGRYLVLGGNTKKSCDVVWVANFRRLKRAEWGIHAAEKLPNYSFVMAGGICGDEDYYENMRLRAVQLSNMQFLGGISFDDSTKLISSAKVLICTSTFEGFPNTFLQAWSQCIPVISTVDPSGVIASNNLGVVVASEDELIQALQNVLSDEIYYKELSKAVSEFFESNCSSQSGYKRLIKFLQQ